MDALATIVERLCAWKDVSRAEVDGKDSFFVRGQIFSYLGKKGVVVKLAPPQVTEALKIPGGRRQPGDGDPHSREFVEIPVKAGMFANEDGEDYEGDLSRAREPEERDVEATDAPT